MDKTWFPTALAGDGASLRRTPRAPALPFEGRGSAGGGLRWSSAPGRLASPEGRANTSSRGPHGGTFRSSNFCGRSNSPRPLSFQSPPLLPSPGNPQPQRPVHT